MKMKLSILSILGILSTIPYLVLANFMPTLNNDDNGVVCELISAGKDSKIHFQIDELAVEDIVNPENIKIPFALFRYSDTAFYNNLEEVEEYSFMYKNSTESRVKMYYGLIDFDTNEFMLERNSISVDGFLPEPHVRTGYLQYRKDREHRQLTEFKIDTSGMYCVLIAPPTDKGIKSLTIPVSYKNSFGYLSVYDYANYYNLKVSFIVGILVLVCLFLVLKRNKEIKLKGSKISNWLVNYVLIPIIIIQAMLLAEIMIPLYLNENSMSEISSSIIAWINTCLKIIFTYYFPLLFSMGVGIIYLIKDSRPVLRKFPELLNKKANVLLYSHILIATSCYISSLVYTNVEEDFFAKLSMTKIALLVLQILDNIVWVFWLSFTTYYYFVTKKSISKFPSFEEAGISKKITIEFRNSLLLINLTTFLPIIEAIVILSRSFWGNYSNIDTLDKLIDDNKVAPISQILVQEKIGLRIFYWANTFFDEYIIILSLFWIWFNHDIDINLKDKQIEKEKFKS